MSVTKSRAERGIEGRSLNLKDQQDREEIEEREHW